MSAAVAEHGLAGVADAGAFLARLTRLDPAALVRLRPPASPAGLAATALWARLPWAVLVSRTVSGRGPGDVTVSAAELLAELSRGGSALPVRRDQGWRWPLPPSAGRVVETMAAAELRRVAAAAAGTLRTATAQGVGGRAVGERVLRDALLDHVAIVVSEQPASAARAAGGRIELPQRLVQAVARMGFLGSEGTDGEEEVHIRLAGRWVGLSAPYGIAWLQPASSLSIKPIGAHTNG